MTGTKGGAIAWHFPLIYQILRLINPNSALFTGHKRLAQDGRKAVLNSRSTASAKNIFASVLEEGSEKNDGSMTDEEIIVEASTLIVGGTDTTATTLAYLVWAVLSDAELQGLLEEELAKIGEPLMDSKLDIPILNAVISETLRLYGASPGALYRVAASEVQLGGYSIPAGTTVSTQAWTAHRDAAIFENPDKFDYTRWLKPMSDRAKMAFTPVSDSNLEL